MAYEVPVTQARAEFADLVNRVAYGGERVVVTRHGKPIAALVPPSDLDRLESGDQPDQQASPVVRLTADALDQPSTARPVPVRPLDIAARHRPVGGDPAARVD